MRIRHADLIRIYATVLIILTHATTLFLVKRVDPLPESWCWIGTFAQAFGRTCVPLFALLSGMLLLSPGKEEPLTAFFQKRFSKIAVPYLAWGIIFVFWSGYHVTWGGKVKAILLMPARPPYYHLWFLQLVVVLYFLTPILRTFLLAAGKKERTYFLVVWSVILGSIWLYPKTDKLLPMIVAAYIGFFAAGGILAQTRISGGQIKLALIVLAVFWVLTATGDRLVARFSGAMSGKSFIESLSPSVAVMAVASFLILKSVSGYESFLEHSKPSEHLFESFAMCSFGIYLIHPIVLELLYAGRLGFKLSPIVCHPLAGIPLTTLVTFVLCAVAVWGIRKVPFLRVIVP